MGSLGPPVATSRHSLGRSYAAGADFAELVPTLKHIWFHFIFVYFPRKVDASRHSEIESGARTPLYVIY
jgi:hypothetical protein